jgi:hypothetical protein
MRQNCELRCGSGLLPLAFTILSYLCQNPPLHLHPLSRLHTRLCSSLALSHQSSLLCTCLSCAWPTDLDVMQAPDSVLTDVTDQSVQPKCLANIRKLKLREGEVQVAPSLTTVLDNFLTAKTLQDIRAQSGAPPLLLRMQTYARHAGPAYTNWCCRRWLGNSGSIAFYCLLILAVALCRSHIQSSIT